MSRAGLKKSGLTEDFHEKTLFGAYPRIAVVLLVGTPAVEAGFVVVCPFASARSRKVCSSYWHKKVETVASTTLSAALVQKSFEDCGLNFDF